MEDTDTCVRAIHDLALAASEASTTTMPDSPEESLPHLVIPNDHALRSLEHLLPQPFRGRGTTVVRSADSFVRLFADWGDLSIARIYGTLQPNPGFVAILNDFSKRGGAGWRDHRIEYRCPLSPEWTTWHGSNKKTMSQEQFAQFIEDNAPDIRSPDSATMFEIARSLEATKKVNFARSVRLPSGETQFTYEETIDGSASKGNLSIPEVFTIGIPVFDGGDAYALDARLRYRINDQGKLAMWYDLLRPHKTLEDAALTVWKLIEGKTETTIIHADAPYNVDSIY